MAHDKQVFVPVFQVIIFLYPLITCIDTTVIFAEQTLCFRYKDRLGIVIGNTQILLRALPMTGRK